MNDKVYLIVNPYSDAATHGIANYFINLKSKLRSLNIPYDYFPNNKNLAPDLFRVELSDYVNNNYGYEEVIIEAPEAKAATLKISKKYKTHVRLHTPIGIAQKYDGVSISQKLYEDELYAINTASFVSSPSYGLISELDGFISQKFISVYKNPSPEVGDCISWVNKDIDVLFLGRFQQLKGVEYINPVLEMLPENCKVVLIGNNSSEFKISQKVICSVEVLDHIGTENRFWYIKRAKNILQLSKFENCSMVIIEGLACHALVHAWDVGGNKEIATEDVLKISPFEDVDYMSNQLLDCLNFEPKANQFDLALKCIDKDFDDGFKSISKGFFGSEVYMGINQQKNWLPNIKYISPGEKLSGHYSIDDFGIRIFGFSISNEHIEEMWAPVLNKIGVDYRFVCPRPLGFHYKFNNPYPVQRDSFIRFDWIRFPDLLLSSIEEFKPHKIIFHNGLHPSYQHVLIRVKSNFPKIPIVYSELGWFPQQGNIYFDTRGTNGASSIAAESFEKFCSRNYPQDHNPNFLVGNILIITQLEGDTNIISNSPMFKSMDNFISHVLKKIPPDVNVVIKTHPLDRDKSRFEKFIDHRVSLIHDGDIEEMLTSAKAVFTINSTVALTALNYPCNIYCFGFGLLDNKRVAVECFRDEYFSSFWSDYEIFPMEAKLAVADQFFIRQINIKSLDKFSISDCLSMKCFQPLVASVFKYPDSLERIKIIEKYSKYIGSSYSKSESGKKNVPAVNNVNRRRRLFKKLLRNPHAYFNDSRVAFLRPFSILFRKLS
jgi:glycosyltransferase involved in cell wall biosynthesis